MIDTHPTAIVIGAVIAVVAVELWRRKVGASRLMTVVLRFLCGGIAAGVALTVVGAARVTRLADASAADRMSQLADGLAVSAWGAVSVVGCTAVAIGVLLYATVRKRPVTSRA